jgi:diguanylate cyclase (GGDEF)-like protein/putative nucleotidyltransferase with HDIG domain
MTKTSTKAKIFIGLVILSGSFVLISGLSHWSSHNWLRYACYFATALVASRLRVILPGINGTMSVNFLFILLGIVELTFPETLAMACSATVVQCLWNVKNPVKPVQALFNVSSMATAVALAYGTYVGMSRLLASGLPLMLLASAAIFFVANTLPVAVVISLIEGKNFRSLWKECYFWCLPYYLAGAAIVGLISSVNRFVGWQTSLLVLPVIYWIYRSYRLYLGRLEGEKKHVEDMASLHLRTIEALALAIEAKDHSTHDHLRRVRVYAVEIAKELRLADSELEAIRASALLHDIGKLAVPENIISKPGRLTQEEFEKMKVHPVVGAEILERVKFPYPVVPIIRSHHEKWDGSGYPDGLKAEEIPIGARILAAVDCLDALASDRQYRRAIPLSQAMAKVRSLSGTHYDPQVVDILERRYVELEQLARTEDADRSHLSTEIRVERGAAPAAGFESSDPAVGPRAVEFLSSIAAARQEAQMLFELSQNLGTSLSLDETLSVLSVRLKRLIPCDCIAVYVCKEDRIIPQFVSGENSRLFSSLEIPMGEGLSGWVASNRKPIINGNPSVEPGYLNDPDKFSTLHSALSVPLEAVNGIVGVLTLYQAEKDAFTKDHLRILLAISSKIAFSVENALRYQLAESSATTDYLTGLPNARSLFLHLDRELARCKRLNSPLTVLVCDLNGFKQVNDRFGHLEGNKVLRIIAQGLQQACREYDYVARMGGDEFVLVVPGISSPAIENKIGQLKQIVLQAGRQVCGEDILSLSVGRAFHPTHGDNAEELLAEADRCMYLAKQQHYSMLRAALSMGVAQSGFTSAVN